MSQVFYIDDWYKIKDDSNKPNFQLAKQYLVKSISEYDIATKKIRLATLQNFERFN